MDKYRKRKEKNFWRGMVITLISALMIDYNNNYHKFNKDKEEVKSLQFKTEDKLDSKIQVYYDEKTGIMYLKDNTNIMCPIFDKDGKPLNLNNYKEENENEK